LSRSIYIDKGYNDGIKTDMAVITGDGIVGKVLRVYRSTSLVLLIDDQTSGVGAILDKTRLQGILRGTPSGEVVLEKVMSDETVPVGEMVLTSGGDGIFPKGLLVGRVTKATPGSELFLNIRVRPAANLSKLEEVLVVTKMDERQAEPDQTGASRAVDILAQRLPGVPSRPAENAAAGTAAPGTAAAPTGATKAGTTTAGTTTTGARTTSGSDSKPKSVPPQASAAVDPLAARKTAPAASSAEPGSESVPKPSSGLPPAARTSATDAAKVSPKPVKAVVAPKPQPATEDSPH
jgi:rod shape-determining protein MreC